MQAVAKSKGREGRYQRGVKSPDPELLGRLTQLLEREPGISKSEAARRLGITRATCTYYFRALREQVQIAKAKVAERKERSLLSHIDLLDRIGMATQEVQQVIAELRAEPATPSTAGAVFRGHGVLQSYLRLLGELLGEVSPPTTNVYLTRVESLLAAPVAISPALQAVLDEATRNEPA